MTHTFHLNKSHVAIRQLLDLDIEPKPAFQYEIEENEDGDQPRMHTEHIEVVGEHAILRYIGRITYVHPTRDALLAALVDAWLERDRDLMAPFSWPTSKETLDAHVLKHLEYFECALTPQGPGDRWLTHTDLSTTADFCWYARLKWLEEKGYGDHFGPFTSRYLELDPRYEQSDTDCDSSSDGSDTCIIPTVQDDLAKKTE